MKNEYSIKEVVKFASEIEKDGIVFYEKMAEKSKNQDIKKTFIKLMNDEKEHYRIYENLFDSLGADTNEYVYHLENEYQEYLHSFIENIVFDYDRIDELANNFKSDKEVIDYALSKENSSIEYFTTMKEIVLENNKEIVDKIINEEIRHITVLTEFKDKLE